jgi:hypothetical protein
VRDVTVTDRDITTDFTPQFSPDGTQTGVSGKPVRFIGIPVDGHIPGARRLEVSAPGEAGPTPPA